MKHAVCGHDIDQVVKSNSEHLAMSLKEKETELDVKHFHP
jgi:hypothetical protein